MTTASNNAPTTYFNLHTQGIGYLNRVREVPVRRGQAFMACDIAALHGAADDVEYTRFDCKVASGEADRLIREHLEDVRAERKVLIAFRIGDLWVDPFMYEKGERKATRREPQRPIDLHRMDQGRWPIQLPCTRSHRVRCCP